MGGIVGELAQLQRLKQPLLPLCMDPFNMQLLPLRAVVQEGTKKAGTEALGSRVSGFNQHWVWPLGREGITALGPAAPLSPPYHLQGPVS